jgi:hypothetical protein
MSSTPTLWERWGAALGVLASVVMAAGFVLAANGPGSSDSDTKITTWYTSSSHQYTQTIGFLGFAIGVLCLIGFLTALRQRTAAAEGTPGVMSQLAFGAGIVSAGLFTMALGLFAVPAFLAIDTSASDIAPAAYRMIYTAAVVSWVAATMIGALTVSATAAVAFRTSFLPRWFAWLSAVVGIVQLLGFFFIPGFIFWAWILIVAILLVRRGAAASPSALAG